MSRWRIIGYLSYLLIHTASLAQPNEDAWLASAAAQYTSTSWPDDALQHLHQLAKLSPPPLRLKALQQLSQLQPEACQGYIVAALTSADRRLREFALSQIHLFVNQETTHHLLEQYFVEVDRELRSLILAELQRRQQEASSLTQIKHFLNDASAKSHQERRQVALNYLGITQKKR